MFDPISLIEHIGLIGIITIVFLESGVFFGFFFPGDSLLFAAGILASQGLLNITALIIFTVIAAILGENVGYAFGQKVGPMLFNRQKSRFFNPAHVAKAHSFFEKHGNKAIFLARFLPIFRTFVPIIAGIARMPFKKFMTYNIVGALVWVPLMTLIGYVLGSRVTNIEEIVAPLMIGIIVISFLPAVYEWWKSKRKS